MYGFYVHPIKKDEIRMGKGKIFKDNNEIR